MDANGIPAKHFQEMERQRYERIEAADNTAEFEERTGGLASENMTVWDEFYKSVMCGICASGPGITWSVESLVADAAKFADAMMAERNKRGN